MYSFPDLKPVCCSMSSSNCYFLTCTQIYQEAGQVVWYSHLFKNFPQFIVIHVVKGFGVVNKAKVMFFWNSLVFSMIQLMLAIWEQCQVQTQKSRCRWRGADDEVNSIVWRQHWVPQGGSCGLGCVHLQGLCGWQEVGPILEVCAWPWILCRLMDFKTTSVCPAFRSVGNQFYDVNIEWWVKTQDENIWIWNQIWAEGWNFVINLPLHVTSEIRIGLKVCCCCC